LATGDPPTNSQTGYTPQVHPQPLDSRHSDAHVGEDVGIELREVQSQSCWPRLSSQFIQATPPPARTAAPTATSTPIRPLLAVA